MSPNLHTLRVAQLLIFVVLLLVGLTSGLFNLDEAARYPGATWEHRDPRALGFAEAELDAFADRIGGDGVVVRDGYIAKSWGRSDRPGDWASAAKPVLSTLLFFAVAEGRINSLDESISPWVRRRFPGRRLWFHDENITFAQLANMTSGYGFRHRPGARWAYNDVAVKLLAELLTEIFDSSLDQAIRQRLALLQFENGDIFGSRGGVGVRASPKDFARIGWLWLHRGGWNDEQILPRRAFSKYQVPQVPADLPRARGMAEDYLRVGTFGGSANEDFRGQGRYGFFWWFNEPMGDRGSPLPHLPEDAFYAMGHEGREVVLVLPEWNVVVAARGNWGGRDLEHTRLLISSLHRVERGRTERVSSTP